MKGALLIPASLLMFLTIAANAQTAHTVVLTWTQSTFSGVTTNKIYRSLTTGTRGSAICTSATPITTYTDGGPLTNGTTYYYCVSALAGSKGESACSAPVIATIPAPPPAPTALSDTIN
jgi:hypothetical protein